MVAHEGLSFAPYREALVEVEADIAVPVQEDSAAVEQATGDIGVPSLGATVGWAA